MGWELPWGNTVRFLQLSMEGAKISVEVRFLFKLNEAMRNFKALIAAAAAFAAISAGAVEIDNAAIKNKSKFGIVFPDNTSYYANADAVVSVSRQNYCAGPLEITEVVIDVLGSPSQVRIYCARAADAAKTAERLAQEKLPEPLKPYAKTPDSIRERVSEAQKLAAGASAVPQIQKIFPATTNSRTIEFIVPSPEELDEFYTIFSNDFIGKATDEKDVSESAKESVKTSQPGIKGKLYKILPPKGMEGVYETFNKKQK